MDSHFLLTFGTTLGRTRILRVKHPSLTVSDALMRSAMNNIINSNAVASTTAGRANSIRRASFVETEVTPIDIGA